MEVQCLVGCLEEVVSQPKSEMSSVSQCIKERILIWRLQEQFLCWKSLPHWTPSPGSTAICVSAKDIRWWSRCPCEARPLRWQWIQVTTGELLNVGARGTCGTTWHLVLQMRRGLLIQRPCPWPMMIHRGCQKERLLGPAQADPYAPLGEVAMSSSALPHSASSGEC